jgi:hypothetical protein
VNTTVIFLHPPGVGTDWGQTDTWDAAGRIPGVSRVVDRDGTEAARFGARTSGHVVLYDSNDRLLFAGGITESRGHAGDNMGRREVERALATEPALFTRHEVFGCAFEDESVSTSGAGAGGP